MPDRRPPLAHLGPEGRSGSAKAVSLSEAAATGKLCLRGDPNDRAFLSAVGSVLDLVLPTEPNTVTDTEGVAVLWAGPDEWLVVLPALDLPEMKGRLADALHGIRSAVVDLSDARSVIRIEGTHARDVLAKGCALDLHPRVFRAGQAAHSLLAGATVTLHQTTDHDAAPAYDIYVPRSLADHLWRWLHDAALEYAA